MITYLSTGSGFTVANNQTMEAGYEDWNIRLRPMDVNGDGRSDLVHAWNNGGNLALLTYISYWWDSRAFDVMKNWQTQQPPVLVTHQGRLISLYVDMNSKLHYSVRRDDGRWTATAELPLPPETTAQTAQAPIQALSDGRHLYVFRQTTANKLYADRFVFDRNIKTLTLGRPLEVRWRRSGKKDEPWGTQDTLGTRDMNNNPFYEATINLETFGVNSVQAGWTVTLIPSLIIGEERWQILVNGQHGSLKSYSFRRAEDGWFTDVDKTIVVPKSDETVGNITLRGRVEVDVDMRVSDAGPLTALGIDDSILAPKMSCTWIRPSRKASVMRGI